MTGDVTIDHAVVRQGLAELLDPLQDDTGPRRVLVLLHEAERDDDAEGDGPEVAEEDADAVLIRESALTLKNHPRQAGSGSAAIADMTGLIIVQVPAGLSVLDEQAVDRTVNRLKQLLDDGEWEGSDGTLVQIDEWESADSGPQGGDGDHSINYAAFKFTGLATRCAGSDVSTVTPPEESEP